MALWEIPDSVYEVVRVVCLSRSWFICAPSPGVYNERKLKAMQKRTYSRRVICFGIQPTPFNLYSPLAEQVHQHECMDDCLLLVWAISKGTN